MSILKTTINAAKGLTEERERTLKQALNTQAAEASRRMIPITNLLDADEFTIQIQRDAEGWMRARVFIKGEFGVVVIEPDTTQDGFVIGRATNLGMDKRSFARRFSQRAAKQAVVYAGILASILDEETITTAWVLLEDEQGEGANK